MIAVSSGSHQYSDNIHQCACMIEQALCVDVDFTCRPVNECVIECLERVWSRGGSDRRGTRV